MATSGLFGLFGGGVFTPVPAPAPVVPFKPGFESVETMTLPNGYVAAMNVQQYADAATAMALASMFSAAAVVLADPAKSPFPGTAPSPARLLQFLPGASIKDKVYGSPITVTNPFTVNAGELAQFFLRMPEDQFPDVVFGTLAKRYAWGNIYDAAVAAVGK